MSDLAYYRRILRVDKHCLDDALETQSQIQDEISSELAQATSRMNLAKDQLDRKTADVIAELKEGKVSETLAAGLAKKDQRRLDLWRVYQDAREEHEQWVGLYDAWQRRGYSIKTLAELYVAQYFAVTSVTTTTSGRTPDDLRERMNAVRTYAPPRRKVVAP